MPVLCSAAGCTNRFVKGSEIRFYRFPISKPQLAEQWVRSLGRKNFVAGPNTCLCSEHFQADCFRDYNGKQFLREDAVPTIFSFGKPPPDAPKIELRRNRGGLVAKETAEAKLRPVDKRPARDTSFKGKMADRKEKRRGTKFSTSDRQALGPKSKVYDSHGLLILSRRDLCDCLDVDCMGCFYPCPECSSRKCGVECRCDRKWLYEQVEVEGGEIIRNKFN